MRASVCPDDPSGGFESRRCSIKLAQALSIRTDLIPEAYALELRQLQVALLMASDGL